MTLYWQADSTPQLDYRLVVQMVDSRGVWGASLERQTDLFHRTPTSRWSPGATMVESVDVNLNPATPPRRFRLELRVLDQAGTAVLARDAAGQPLGDAIPLGEVEILDPQAASPPRKALRWFTAGPRRILDAVRRLAPTRPS